MTKSPPRNESLRERANPKWYHWSGVVVPGVIVLITCINRAPEFGLSVWVANLVVLVACATVIGCVTYWMSEFASGISFAATIIGGSLAVAGLSHIIPVIVVTYGSLWAGCGLGSMIALTLFVRERRQV